jgi:hypothetical protein
VSELHASIAALDALAADCEATFASPAMDAAARSLIERIAGTLFGVPMSRCYSADVLGESRSHATLPLSLQRRDWDWSRTLPDSSSEPMSLDRIRRGLRAVLPRVELVTQIADVHLGRVRPEVLLSAARAAPWRYDTASVEGVRNRYIVARGIGDEGYQARVYREIESDRSIHCGTDDGQSFAQRFLHDQDMTDGELRAIEAMMEHTPADVSLGRCSHIASPRISSRTPIAERARWLARFDCSEARHPRLRGRAIGEYVGASFVSRTPVLGVELSSALRGDHPACFSAAGVR